MVSLVSLITMAVKSILQARSISVFWTVIPVVSYWLALGCVPVLKQKYFLVLLYFFRLKDSVTTMDFFDTFLFIE